MAYMFRCSSRNTVEEIIKSLLEREERSSNDETHNLVMEFFHLFCKSGVDYYDLIALYSTFSHYTENELQALLKYAPSPLAYLSPSSGDIRKAIPRWTASRYHSGTIESIIKEIQVKLLSGSPGIFCYNSNLNPKNQRSLNDLYVLIITKKENRWFDINRKCTYKFTLGANLYDKDCYCGR